MKLNFFQMVEFNNIKARLQEIHDGEYLDKSYGNLGQESQELLSRYNIDVDMKIFMGPLQIQE